MNTIQRAILFLLKKYGLEAPTTQQYLANLADSNLFFQVKKRQLNDSFKLQIPETHLNVFA